ncbi:glycine cleavage system aminomethyltransferase GcvT [Pseudomonas sp. F1_0610]|uniref:glycine cleavage system aminomethyltransferase GcvT n=1 Tax=Pseudomonas sp. F1_0610 TaxID=3114284 RepID=UPI0039C24D6D
MGLRTPMYDLHVALGAKMVDFNEWELPLHYGSQIEEHNQVRNDCGVFDISHLTITDISGSQATSFLQKLLCSDVAKLATKQMCFSLLLDENAGIIDEVAVMQLDNGYRLLTNAATKLSVRQWLTKHADDFTISIEAQDDLAILAIQGPNTYSHLKTVLNSSRKALLEQLQPHQGAADGDWFIARMGYTGEEGFEIFLPSEQAVNLFNELMGSGISPIGIGARDTLRIEAGYPLYGVDINAAIQPACLGLNDRIDLEPSTRSFIGRNKITKRDQCERVLVGLVLEERGVLRQGQPVHIEGFGEGVITSGSFSPTLSKAIALALVPAAAQDRAEVEIRGKWHPVRIVQPPFVRHGKILV